VKSPLLEIPSRGWLNLHPAYLPFNRGKHPNFWCLVEETPCGAALHFIDRGVDTGPLLARAQLETSWEDTGESVHRRCRELAVDLFTRNFDKVASGSLKPQPQDPSEGSSHRAAQIEIASEIQLDATYTARRLLNIVRARMFPPHPTAFFTDGGRRFSVEVRIREIPESAA
jgi:methionyl-tRNA formyltransferase